MFQIQIGSQQIDLKEVGIADEFHGLNDSEVIGPDLSFESRWNADGIEALNDLIKQPDLQSFTIDFFPRPLKSKKKRIIKKWFKRYGKQITLEGYISNFTINDLYGNPLESKPTAEITIEAKRIS